MKKLPPNGVRLANLRTLAWSVNTKGKLGSCYLAGPMTGLPDFNAPAFRRCAETLRLCGWTVMSPVENDENDGLVLDGADGTETFDYRRAMAWDLKQVCECDCVIVMAGWEESKGCLLEVSVALEVGTPVYTYLSQRKITWEDLVIAKSGSTGSCPAPSRAGTEEGGLTAQPSPSSPIATLPPGTMIRVGDIKEAQHAAGLEEFVTTNVKNPTSQVMPVESAARKSLPLATGVIDYFPAALAAVAEVSRVGNDKHNPGQPLHHARGKSMDHADAIARHLVDRGQVDPDTGLSHSAELAWRSLALLQEELEDYGAPLARGARHER